MHASAFERHLEHPPVGRRLILLLALLLAMQLRSDRPADGDAGEWGGNRGLRQLLLLRETIRERVIHPPSDRRLYMAALAGMLASLDDRWSAYLPPRAMRHLSRRLEQGATGGIGVHVRPRSGGGLEVLWAFDGLPAARAGIRAGDVILAVDGVDIMRMNPRDSVELILGPMHSRVELRVQRGERIFNAAVAREPLPRLQPAFFLDKPGGVACLVIDLFAEGLARQVRREVERLRQAGMRGLIVDLRRSPGGELQAGIAMSDLFLTRGVITSVRERVAGAAPGATRLHSYRARSDHLGDFPLVLLVNGITASAAELFAAAIRDNGRGVLVGEKTFGKGRVQVMLPLGRFAGAVKLTTGTYLTPAGRDLEGKGLSPDLAVPMAASQRRKAGRALYAAQLGRSGSVPELLESDPQMRRALEAIRRRIKQARGGNLR